MIENDCIPYQISNDTMISVNYNRLNQLNRIEFYTLQFSQKIHLKISKNNEIKKGPEFKKFNGDFGMEFGFNCKS